MKPVPHPIWTKIRDIKYDWPDATDDLQEVQDELYKKTKSLTPPDLFLSFFDEEVLSFIAEQTEIYAQKAQNYQNFSLKIPELKRFLGIFYQATIHFLLLLIIGAWTRHSVYKSYGKP